MTALEQAVRGFAEALASDDWNRARCWAEVAWTLFENGWTEEPASRHVADEQGGDVKDENVNETLVAAFAERKERRPRRDPFHPDPRFERLLELREKDRLTFERLDPATKISLGLYKAEKTAAASDEEGGQT